MTHSFEASSDPDINSVWHWFQFQLTLIAQERIHVLRTFPASAEIVPESAHTSQFIGLTEEEIDEVFDAQKGRLELLSMFDLLATTEAILRNDFKARVAARGKDGLSRRFRKLQRKSSDKIRLDEDILGAMQEEGVSASIVAAGRGVLKLRHWLAHGRHWHPKLGRGYSPDDVFEIAKALIRSMPPL